MKIVLHLVVDEEEISLEAIERLSMNKSEIKSILAEIFYEDNIRPIEDWCEVYKFVEDERDIHRKE